VFLAISDTAQISFGEINSIMSFQKHIEIMDISIDHKNSVLSQLEDWFNENKPEAKHLWYTTESVSEICFLFGFHNRYIPCLPSLDVYDKMTELPIS
jgi:hypothetical protein